MTTVAALILAAAAGLALAAWWRLPAAFTCIVAGLVVAGAAPTDTALVRELMLLASTFLVFAIGAEVDYRQVAPFHRRGWPIALGQLAVMAALGVGGAAWLGLDARAATYVALAFAASSTPLILDSLRAGGRLFEPIGRMTVAVSLTTDVIVMAALAVLSGALQGVAAAGRDLAALVALAAVAVVVRGWVSPRVLLHRTLDEEEHLLFVLAVLFGFLGAASWLDLPAVTGAFLGGVALSSYPAAGLVRGQLSTFTDFFTATFYVALGTLLTIPSASLLAREVLVVVLFLGVGLALLLPALRRAGLPLRAALEGAALLTQCGELALVVVLVGRERGHLPDGAVDFVVVVAAMTLTGASWLSQDAVSWRLTSRRRPPPETGAGGPQDHLVLLGCGDAGEALLTQMGGAAPPIVVVDDDPAVLRRVRERGFRAVRGDALDLAVLQAAGADRARAIVSTLRRPSDHRRLMELVRGPRMFIRVFSRAEAEAVRALGGHPIVEADLAAAAFLRWYEARFAGDPEGRPG